MFTKKTVFVVGAGGSKELGLPIGSELTGKIASSLDIKFRNHREVVSGDSRIVDAIMKILDGKSPSDPTPYINACRNISRAMPLAPSIDNYLHTHFENEKLVQMGKIAITAIILEEERTSKLFADERQGARHDFKTTSNTWHNLFCKMLMEGIQRSELQYIFDNVAFITFNYDRCIEQYVARALQTYMQISEDLAQELTAELTVIHPYGQVGKLPWRRGREVPIAFGGEFTGSDLPKIAANIRTFTEQIDDVAVTQRITNLLDEAQKIVFLGFSFGAMNLDLLRLSKPRGFKDIYATSHGISEGNIDIIRKRIGRNMVAELENRIADSYYQPVYCRQLLEDYYRHFTE